MKRGWARTLIRQYIANKQAKYDCWYLENKKWIESLKEETE